MFRFTYGSADNLVEFLHADNFCQAHIKAAEAMEDPQSPVVSGVSWREGIFVTLEGEGGRESWRKE